MTQPVEPRPAATVVLLRPGAAGPEVLLSRRPASMAFAPDVHVFPGGRVDPADAHPSLIARSVLTPDAAAAALGGDLPPTAAIAAYIAAIREAFEEAGVLLADGPPSSPGTLGAARVALVAGEIGFQALAAQLDLTLRTDWLTPLSRWVTPPAYPRRFDARFFAAALPDGSVASIEGDEVVEHGWLRPADALMAMAEGRLDLWLPTSTTLQQLEHVHDYAEIPRSAGAWAARGDRRGPAGTGRGPHLDAGRRRRRGPAGERLSRGTALVRAGRPGRPDGAGARVRRGGGGGARRDHRGRRADARGRRSCRRRGGARRTARRAGHRAGPGGGGPLPYPVREVADGDRLDVGDVPIRVVATPGPRPDHLAFVLGEGQTVLTGDLDGRRGARMLPGPSDDAAWAASRARLAAVAPGATRLVGHPSDTL